MSIKIGEGAFHYLVMYTINKTVLLYYSTITFRVFAGIKQTEFKYIYTFYFLLFRMYAETRSLWKKEES